MTDSNSSAAAKPKTKRNAILIVLAVLIIGLIYAYQKFVIGNAEAADSIVIQEWSTGEIQDIPVSLDVTPDGKVYVTETGQFSQGVGDNRMQSFWLEDDLASTSTDDRLAYIKKWIAAGELTDNWFTDVHDTLSAIEDRDGDGKADTRTVVTKIGGYLDGIMAGVLVIDDGILLTDIPKVYKLHDTDGDLKADVTEVLSEGYGVRTAFVGHDLHGLTQGPDGKIYFSVADRGFNVTTKEGKHLEAPLDQGRGAVFRMNPDGTDLELFAWGLRNPQELAFDNYGNLLTGDNNSDGNDKARIVYLVEGGDSGWTYGYQYMADEDYLRGPWNAERMWEPYNPNQPAWMLPPIANETNGPSGVAFYPGLGLPERYQNHFFVSNYSFIAAGSWMLSFALVPDGAGFTLDDVHKFAKNDLFIDQDFGYDGRMYAITSSVFAGPKRILTLAGAQEQSDPRIKEVRDLILAGVDTLETDRLLQLLDSADQRLRLQAQFELVKRNAVVELNAVAIDQDATEMQRVHALWGLGQLGAPAFSGWQDFSGFEGELRAQAIKVAGQARAVNLVSSVRAEINSPHPRSSFFAAMSAGKLGDTAALPNLLTLLERNNNKDAYLRHAAVMGLVGLHDADLLYSQRANPSPAVRMGIVLAQRRLEDPRIAEFLQDNEPALVIEAARAIHDLRLEQALPALAAMAVRAPIITGDDPQTSFALHRRVINANLLLGGEAQASALAAYANESANPRAMRLLALDTLREFAQPPTRDKVWGDHMLLAPRDKSVVYAALDQYMPQLVAGELSETAMEVALAYDRIPLDDEGLSAMVADSHTSSNTRISALHALARRESARTSGLLQHAIAVAQASDEPLLRAQGLTLLAVVDSDKALAQAVAIATAGDAANLTEQQAAIALLGGYNDKAAVAYLTRAMHQLADGELAPEIQLDVLNAAKASTAPQVTSAFATYSQAIAAMTPLQQRQITRAGGDPVKGKSVFENLGDCLRCHAINKRGGVVGPDLGGIADRRDNDYLLRALVEPGADIAPGFGSVALELQDGTSMAGILLNESADVVRLQQETGHGDATVIEVAVPDISKKNGPFSGMPPMGVVLSLDDLRDVMAYLQAQKAQNPLLQTTTSNMSALHAQ